MSATDCNTDLVSFCRSQVLLVPAVYDADTAVLHILWRGLRGHHP